MTRPRSRIRTRRVAVLLLTAAGLFTALHIASAWCVFAFLPGGRYATFCFAGLIGIEKSNMSVSVSPFASSLGPFEVAWHHQDMHWWFYSGFASSSSITWTVPLWIPTLCVLLPGIYLFYRTRAPRPGHCPTCRYNLTGLPRNSPCPECGKPPTPKEV